MCIRDSRQIVHAGNLAMPDARRTRQHVNGLLGQIPRPVGAHHHESSRAVGDKAAVINREWVADHPGGENVLQAQRVPRERFRIKLSPTSGSHRNLGELTPGRSILVHVPRGNERVRRGRVERLIRCFIWQRV